MVFPGGVTTAYGYNASNWLSSIKTVGPTGTILSPYSFDQVGNITTKSSEHGSYNYGYDATYQLTSASNPTLPAESFGYDQVGNRLSSRDVTGALSYNANNELIGHSGVTYEYDANGNTVKKSEGTGSDQVPVPLETRYQYNARNRLEKVYLPDGRLASYRYDPFGRRVSKQVGNDTTYFAYADEGVVGEYDASGQMQKAYGWKPSGLWGTNPLYLAENGEYFFYHNDHLGTPQRLTDGSGNVAWSAGYAAFGLAVVDPTSTVENNLRFPGHYFDAETGLHYNFQRTYEPETRRYTQVDPIGFKARDVNFYRYVSNRPLVLIDIFGLEKQVSVTFGGTVLVGALFGTGPGLGGGIGLGVSIGDSFLDTQLTVSVQANGMVGQGVFAGLGAQTSVGSTDGPLPMISTSNYGHAEVNGGFILTGGVGVDVPVSYCMELLFLGIRHIYL